jgi:hypothetical protein
MKKKEKKDKLRRLLLSRETIQVLDEPVLLELARGGNACPRTSSYTGLEDSAGCGTE